MSFGEPGNDAVEAGQASGRARKSKSLRYPQAITKIRGILQSTSARRNPSTALLDIALVLADLREERT